MARAHLALALVCAAALALAGPAAAADAPAAAAKEGKITTAAWFPKLGATASSALPAGEVVSVVVAARNEGDEPYTLGAMVGGVSTADGQMRIQNFTRSLIGEELLPGQETSVEYNFYLNPILAGRDFGVAVALLYTGKAPEAGKGDDAPAASPRQFVAVAFNQTVDVVEPPRLVDTEAIFMFAVLGAMGLGVLYFAWAVAAERLGLPAPSAVLGLDGAAGGGAKGGAGAAAAAAAAAAAKKAAAKSAVDDDEWVKGTSYDLAAKRKRQQAAAARVR